MKTTLAAVLAGLALGAGPTVARAQELRVALPEQHELVEIQPGVQVIPDFDLEVYFTGNTYWLRGDDGWYSSRRASSPTVFMLADQRSVPAALSRLPAGTHLNYSPQPGQKRSTKVLAAMEPPAPEPEEVPAPTPVVTKPAAAPAPAKKPAPAKGTATKGTATKAPPPKGAPATTTSGKTTTAKPAPATTTSGKTTTAKPAPAKTDPKKAPAKPAETPDKP
jgi:hypothetical protein